MAAAGGGEREGGDDDNEDGGNGGRGGRGGRPHPSEKKVLRTLVVVDAPVPDEDRNDGGDGGGGDVGDSSNRNGTKKDLPSLYDVFSKTVEKEFLQPTRSKCSAENTMTMFGFCITLCTTDRVCRDVD